MNDNSTDLANALPEGLRQGWINFNQWAVAREKAGSPLPPGGVFILDKFAVLKDELLVLKHLISEKLNIKPESVDVDIETIDGNVLPKINVKDVDEIDEKEVDSTLRECCDIFRAKLRDRLDNLSGREELKPHDIEDLLDTLDTLDDKEKLQTCSLQQDG